MEPDLATHDELPFWRAACRRARRPSCEGQTRNAASDEERRRLLYVALTRARDRLYVTGWLPRSGEPARRALHGTSWPGLPSCRAER